jgi:DUF4097 and DUF4098 domain-containing protein YvlB
MSSGPVVAPPRRRRSMAGPMVLIIVGLIFLLGNMHLISWGRLGVLFAHYWPLLLILWGVLKLVEHQRAKQEGQQAPGIGAGGVFLLIVLIIAGLSASQMSRVDWKEVGDQLDIDGVEIPGIGSTYTYDDLPSMTQALPAGASVKIVNDRGAVNVTESTDNQIHLTVQKKIRSESKSDADKWNDATKPQINVSGNLVTISANTRGAGNHPISADLNLEIPRKAPVTISTQRGEIVVNGRDGAVDISSQHGDVNADDINGNINLNLDHGSARISQVSGDVTIQGRGDDVTLTDIKGAARLNGEIQSVKLSRVAKAVGFKSARTELEFARLNGDLDLDSDSLHGSDLAGPLRLSTRSKDITLEGVAGDARIENANSPVDLQLKSAGNVQIDNRNGDITVGVPEKMGFKVDARSRGSEISSEFSELQPKNDDNQGSLSGTIGNGASHIVLNSEHGTISIRRASPTPPSPPEPPAPPKGQGHRSMPQPPTPPKLPSNSNSAPTEN